MFAKIIYIAFVNILLFIASALVVYLFLALLDMLVYFPVALVLDFILFIFLAGILINREEL